MPQQALQERAGTEEDNAFRALHEPYLTGYLEPFGSRSHITDEN